MSFAYPRRFSRRILTIAFLLSFLPLATHAQSLANSGTVTGTVTDSSGAAIANASVALRAPAFAIQLTTTTGPDGSFTFSGVPSGDYTLRIAAPGFAPYSNPSIAVAIGRQTTANAVLLPARTTQQVTVHAETQTLDTSQSSPVTNIDRDRIEELPIPSRNYLSFALLSPALASANSALNRITPGVSEAGFSAGGLRPSSNSLVIDGSEDDDEFTGLSRTQLSPEAVSDFQIVQHGYSAQFGGSAGGSVNVETRSGANLQHGDSFLFVQNGTLNATPALERVPRKPDESRIRVGLSTGGHVPHSLLYYHTAAELEHSRGEEAGDLNPALISQIQSSLNRAGPLPGFQLQQGFFPTTNQETEASLRVDRSTTRHSLMLRYALTNNRSVNDAFHTTELDDLSARGSAFYLDNSLTGNWSQTLSTHLWNQVSFQAAQRRVLLRTGSTSGPGILVAGLARFGTPFSGNSRRFETHLDLGDSLILQRHHHLFGAGFSLRRIALRTDDRSGFQGLYLFPTLDALANAAPNLYVQSFGQPLTNFAELRAAFYFQDHWTPLRTLALDYGLRESFSRLPAPLPQDTLNLAPRLGFAWSPNRNWVVRGGFGVFYDRYLLSTVNRIQQLNGSRAFQQIAEGPAAASLYQSGAQFAQPIPGLAPSISQAQPGLRNPYALTASLGIEHALPAQWTLSAEYRFVRGVRMGRTVNVNLPPPILLTSSNAASLGIPAPTPQQLGRLVFPAARLNPAYDAINQFQTEASSNHNAVTLTLNRQFTDQFELMAGYTFSKTLDDASYDTEQPQNPYAPSQEYAPSLNDQRQRFVLSALWLLGPDLDDPQDRTNAAHPSPLQRFLYGFEFTPILIAGTGFPDNPLTGSDSNQEHIYPLAARPLGLARNALRTPAPLHFDLRILRMVPLWRGHLDIVAESFNLLNRANVSLLNSVYGSDLTPLPTFRQPTQIADPRRIQFSLDYEY